MTGCERILTLKTGGVWLLIMVLQLVAPFAVSEEDFQYSDTARDATGSIRVEWRSMGDFFPNSGYGCFIHPDGYILTDQHVIADPAKNAGRERTSSSLVLMTFTPPGKDETARNTEVIATDRRTNLAILKVDMEGVPYLELSDEYQPEVDDPVWVVEGTSLRQGVVRELERSSKGRVNGFETDIHIAESVDGSPILDENGKIIGVRMSSEDVLRQNSRSPTALYVKEFIFRYAVDIDINPSVITDVKKQLQVSLTPVMIVKDIAKATVEVSIGEESVEHTLEFADGKLTAAFKVPDVPDLKKSDFSEAYLRFIFWDEAGERIWWRRIKVDIVNLDTSARRGYEGPVLQERELEIGNYETARADGRAEHDSRSISSVAASYDLQKNIETSPKMDNATVVEANDVRPDPARYENLEEEMLRVLAEKFDVLSMGLERAHNSQIALENARQPDRAALTRIDNQIEEIAADRGRIAVQVKDAEICRCFGRLWYRCANAKCDVVKFKAEIDELVAAFRADDVKAALRVLLGG